MRYTLASLAWTALNAILWDWVIEGVPSFSIAVSAICFYVAGVIVLVEKA